MWRRVELKNYRSIERVAVDLAPFTVLVGPNGSGKSNFADALVFARDVAVDAASGVERRAGIVGVRRWRPTKPTDVTIDIVAAETRRQLKTDYTRHQFTIHSGKSGDWRFSRELIEVLHKGAEVASVRRKGDELDISPKRPSPQLPLPLSLPSRKGSLAPSASAMVLARQLGPLARRVVALRNVRRIRLNPDAMRLPQPATEHTRLDESGNNVAVAYRSLDASQQAEVKAAMQKIVPGLSDITVDPFDRFLLLRFHQRQRESEEATFSATEMSEGALRALGILVAAQQMTRDELLIIEEPEVSIHVGAAQLLFEVLKDASERGAVLLTTHSADLLDAARDQEILVCSYVDGVTKIGPLSRAQRKIVKNGLFTTAELMRSEPLRIEGEPGVPAEP